MQGEVLYLSPKQLGFSVSLRNLPCFAGFIGVLGGFIEMVLRFANQAAVRWLKYARVSTDLRWYTPIGRTQQADYCGSEKSKTLYPVDSG
jgi:hypothetical protein